MPLSAVDFFFQKSKKSLGQEYNQIHSIKTVWVQMRHNILSGMIWVQSVSKGYQQTTLLKLKQA